MANQPSIASLFGGQPRSKLDETTTLNTVIFTTKSGETRRFEDVDKEGVSILSLYALLDDTIVKTTIEVTYVRQGS